MERKELSRCDKELLRKKLFYVWAALNLLLAIFVIFFLLPIGKFTAYFDLFVKGLIYYGYILLVEGFLLIFAILKKNKRWLITLLVAMEISEKGELKENSELYNEAILPAYVAYTRVTIKKLALITIVIAILIVGILAFMF
ncbi:MAG: hypothetical protein ACP6IU_08495 [Candidatus Asgardarchaeia archaeon]